MSPYWGFPSLSATDKACRCLSITHYDQGFFDVDELRCFSENCFSNFTTPAITISDYKEVTHKVCYLYNQFQQVARVFYCDYLHGFCSLMDD